MSNQKSFDIERFIRDVTDKIWNRKMVGSIYHHYLHNVQLQDASGRSHYGQEQVITETINWLAAFPDNCLRIDDIIWAGNDQEDYLTSMRYMVTRHNTGPTIYGPPTGRRIRLGGVTNYRIQAGKIVEEHTETGEFGLLRQLYTLPVDETFDPDFQDDELF